MPRLRLISRAETQDPLVLFLYDRKFPGRDPAVDPGATVSGAPVNYVAVLAHSPRSEEHTSELQSLMRISYAVFCLIKKNNEHNYPHLTKTHTSTPLTYCPT